MVFAFTTGGEISERSAAATETLESPSSRIELNTPYSYRVIERVTGETLLGESGGITFTESRYTVKNGRESLPKLSREPVPGQHAEPREPP